MDFPRKDAKKQFFSIFHSSMPKDEETLRDTLNILYQVDR